MQFQLYIFSLCRLYFFPPHGLQQFVYSDQEHRNALTDQVCKDIVNLCRQVEEQEMFKV